MSPPTSLWTRPRYLPIAVLDVDDVVAHGERAQIFEERLLVLRCGPALGAVSAASEESPPR